MAKSGIIYGSTSNQYIESMIEWSCEQDLNANTSTITAKLYYKRKNTGHSTYGTGNFSIFIDGRRSAASNTITIADFSWVLAMTATRTVTHNSDGTKSIPISATGAISGTTLTSTTCSETIILDTIPRASELSYVQPTRTTSSLVAMWTPLSKDFRYRLHLSFGAWSGTTEIIHPNTIASYMYHNYKLPIDVAKQFAPDSDKGTMQVSLYTYSDAEATVQVGNPHTTTVQVVLSEDENTMPTISMSLSAITPYEKFSNLYLRGISKVKATFEGEGKYDAYIVAYSLQVEGGRYAEPNASKEYISDVLTYSGEQTIVGFVSDSRWFGNNVSEKINVIAYEAPYISPSSANNRVICERCDKDGNAKDDGTYLHIKGKRNYTKIDTDGIVNTCTVSCKYKAEGGNWSDEIAVHPYTDTSTDEFDVVLADIVTDTTLTYTIELRIVDDTNIPATMHFYIPSEEVAFHLREGGGGAAFGKYSITPDLLECVWDAKFHKGVYIQGEAVTDFIVEQGSTDIWLYRKWYSGKAECWGRRAVSVNISTKWEVIYYTTVDKYAFPSGLFTDAPMCQVTAEFGSTLQSAWIGVGGEASKDYAPGVIFCRPNIAEAGFDILYYAIGNWK